MMIRKFEMTERTLMMTLLLRELFRSLPEKLMMSSTTLRQVLREWQETQMMTIVSRTFDAVMSRFCKSFNNM